MVKIRWLKWLSKNYMSDVSPRYWKLEKLANLLAFVFKRIKSFGVPFINGSKNRWGGLYLFVIYIYIYIYICLHSPVPSHLIILYAIVFFFFFFFFFFLGPRRIHLCGSHTRKSSVYLEKHCAQTRGYYSQEQYNDIFVYLSKNFYTSFR
jgi:hypothetical protein